MNGSGNGGAGGALTAIPAQYEAYEALLLERDQARKEAEQAEIAYIAEFGALLTDVFAQQVACARCKKAIAYCQQRRNRGLSVDPEALEAYLKAEMAAYELRLRQMMRQRDACRDLERAPLYALRRSKEIYHRIAKRLHPDIYPMTDQDETLSELWNRVVGAYRANDVKALSDLEALVGRALRERGEAGFSVKIPDVLERMEEIRKEMEEIRRTEPWIWRLILDDPEAVRLKREQLEKELSDAEQYRQRLEQALADLKTGGEGKILWMTN